MSTCGPSKFPRSKSFVLQLTVLVSILLAGCAHSARNPATNAPPLKALIVVAHPDDEYFFAATTFRIARELGGRVDQVVITNGESGYKYSLPADKIYGIDGLSTEAVGRKRLPEIRKNELMGSGKILGINEHIFFDQPDFGYTKDPTEVFQKWEKREKIISAIEQRLRDGNYDIVLTVLPTTATHGHHQAATHLALEAAARIPEANRPLVFGAWNETQTGVPRPNDPDQKEEMDAARAYVGAPGFPLSTPFADLKLQFDRSARFGFKGHLNYHIWVNWMIAEHKSQGLFQTYFYREDLENFRLFLDGRPATPELKARAEHIFEAIRPPVYVEAAE